MRFIVAIFFIFLLQVSALAQKIKTETEIRTDENAKELIKIETHFYKNGDIRGCKFNATKFLKRKKEYDNGQKAFEYLEENGTKYWAVYNQKGQILIKYPTDNDFCKAEFYENGKKVEIPYYFDQKEFEEIYEKIKNDVNKT